MRRALYWLVLCLSVLVLDACGVMSRGGSSSSPADMQSPESAMVYGYVEADDDTINRVDIVEYNKVYIPPFQTPPQVMVFDDGVFMATNIKPGNYVIADFRSARNNYNMIRSKRQAYQHIFHIKPGDMHYLGSYNLRVTKRGKISFGDFKVTPLERPGEREALMRLYYATEGTAWQDKIARRLKELRQ